VAVDGTGDLQASASTAALGTEWSER